MMTIEQRVAALEALLKVKALEEASPEGYYMSVHSGEEIDAAVGDILAGKVVIPSSTSGSTKKFQIKVDDNGAITATEVTA